MDIKKKHLEIILDHLKPHPNPKFHLEQYTIEGKLASEILFFARQDICNNFVIDLGCGTGKLAIGAKLMGAKRVLGIDIDKETIEVAKFNVKQVLSIVGDEDRLNSYGSYNNEPIPFDNDNIIFMQNDINNVDKEFIDGYAPDKNVKNIVIQNPPFGSQKKHADRIFLDKALDIGDVIYTIHNTPTRDFVINYIENKGRKITNIFQANFRIPRIYKFHKKRYMETPVDIYRVV
jgi:putative methylase